jgi:hypothetical protein
MKIKNLFENYIREGRDPGTAYIKRVKRNDGESMLVSSDKWGHKKYWRDSEGGLKKAQEHSKADLDEGLRDALGAVDTGVRTAANQFGGDYVAAGVDYLAKRALGRRTTYRRELDQEFRKTDAQTARNPTAASVGSTVGTIMSLAPLVRPLRALTRGGRVAQGVASTGAPLATAGGDIATRRINEDVPCSEPITTDPDLPTSRLIGTNSVVRIFKSKTPGQNVANETYQQTYELVSAILAERAPTPPRRTPPTPRPSGPGTGVGLLRTAARGAVGVDAAMGINQDMARKRAEGRQTYNQALATSTAAAAGQVGGAEYGWRLGMRAPGGLRVRIPAAIALGALGGTLGHDAVDSVGERIFHRESIVLDESFELAFDYQGKPSIAPTAGQLMMQAKGAFAHHTDVQNVVDVQAIKESIQKQVEQTVLEEDTELLAEKCVVLVGMVNTALDTIEYIKESNIERDAWSEAQILKLERYIESVAKYLENISEDTVPVMRRSYMRTDPRTGERKRVWGRPYKRRRDFDDDDDGDKDQPKGPLSV